jgi:serine O-acetyltransferase
LTAEFFIFWGGVIVFRQLREDIACVKSRDPAARSAFEIFLLYPGLKAIRLHRLANWFYRHNMFFMARWISQRASKKTGVEIHPAVQIGKRFFIDHGTGVVIGETAVIGDDVTIYQGVTLGGTGKDTGKRHPTIGNNVMIGAGAKVLGPLEIGDNSRIAAGAVVLHDIPPNSTAVGVPARVVKRDGIRVDDLNQVDIPDPVANEIARLEAEIINLKSKLNMED